MLKKIMLPVLVVSLSSLYLNSAAAANHGAYVDLNLGTNVIHVDSINIFGTSTSSDTNVSGFGWNADLGYQLNRFIAAEVGFTQYINTNNSNGNTATLQNADIAAKLMLPFNDRFNIFGKIGPSVFFGSNVSSQAGVYTAIGAAFAVTPQVDLVAQFANNFLFLPLGSVGLLSIGATYHFAV